MRRHRALLLAIAGGVTFALTSPPTDLYPAVIVGLALLAWSIDDAPTAWRAFGRATVWGTSAGIVGLRFVPAVIQRFTPLGSAASYLALVLLAAAQSLIWAIGAAVAHTLRRRAHLPREIAFAGGVLVAVSLPTVFAWTPAGLVSPWPAMVQLADLIGERGVSAIFAVAAALLARSAIGAVGAERPPWSEAATPRVSSSPGAPRGAAAWRAAPKPALGAAGILIALAAYGAVRMRSVRAASADLPTVRVALVDHAIGPHERWDHKNHPAILERLRSLTRRAQDEGAELTIWPEAAYPYPLDHGTSRAPRGPTGILGSGVRGPVLVGLITRDRPVRDGDGHVERNSFNSATVVLPDGTMQPTYDKLQLLWFGEMVPLGAELPWLRRMFQRSGGLIPGTEPRALTLPRAGGPALRMGVLNCYEDTLPGVGRRIVNALEPNLLVNVTNDAWFFGTAEPELHARLGAMRAIEQRRDLVRAVNMGVASWVDAAGTVRARYSGEPPELLFATPAVRDAPLTFYARFGDAPLFALFVAGAIASALRARSRKQPAAAPAAEPARAVDESAGEAETSPAAEAKASPAADAPDADLSR